MQRIAGAEGKGAEKAEKEGAPVCIEIRSMRGAGEGGVTEGEGGLEEAETSWHSEVKQRKCAKISMLEKKRYSRRKRNLRKGV